jgi:signal transduction histidine kinase
VEVTRERLLPAAGLLALLLAECALRPAGFPFTLAAGLVVIALGVAWPHRPLASAAAVVLACAAAVAAGLLVDAPSQPGLAATAALYVAGARVARCAQRPSTVVSLYLVGVAALVLGRVGLTAAWAWALAMLGVLGWLLAFSTGLAVRLADGRRRAALAEARRQERLELARELHDVVAHHVAAIVVQAQAARLLGEDGTPPPPGQLAGIEAAGTEALAAMRRVIGLLRAEDGVPLAGPESVADLVARFERHGPAVDVGGELDPALPGPVAGTVYRLVQEGLTNVRLHAPGATTVRVEVRPGPGDVTVRVADDGPWQPPGPTGHGLAGMRERVEALGGTFGAGPEPAGGWAVRAVIPLGAT